MTVHGRSSRLPARECDAGRPSSRRRRDDIGDEHRGLDVGADDSFGLDDAGRGRPPRLPLLRGAHSQYHHDDDEMMVDQHHIHEQEDDYYYRELSIFNCCGADLSSTLTSIAPYPEQQPQTVSSPSPDVDHLAALLCREERDYSDPFPPMYYPLEFERDTLDASSRYVLPTRFMFQCSCAISTAYSII